MNPRAASAWWRVSIAACLLLALALFACRPAWRPDGRCVLFACRDGEGRLGIAVYDRATGRSEPVGPAPSGARAGERLVVPLWTPDGEQMVFVTGGRQRRGLQVVVQSFVDRAVKRSFEVDADAAEALVVPPIVHGRWMFLAAGGIQRVDLVRGAVDQQVQAAAGAQYVLVPAGAGIGYARATKGQESRCEIGTLDPDSLATRPVVQLDAELGWDVTAIPAFSPDGSRIAVPATSRDDGTAALLVFAGGTLETTLRVDGAARLGCAAWAANGATLYATALREDAEGRAALSLVETMVGGSVVRETVILRTTQRPRESAAMLLSCQLALSPDGKTAALTTALLDDVAADAHGLYLIDLGAGARAARRVPFPKLTPPETLRLAGSDLMLELGGALAGAFQVTEPSLEMAVVGGGTGRGIADLVAGHAELAMATRAPKPGEEVLARQAEKVLVVQPIAREAIVVCVHKDNPLAAISLAQLAAVFGANGPGTWADLGVTMPAAHAGVQAAGSAVNTSAADSFRVRVLAGGGTGGHVAAMGGKELVGFVASHPAGIAFVARAHADDSVKLVPVRVGDAAAVAPTDASIADDSYPLQHALLLISTKSTSPATQRFLAWCSGAAGRAVVAQQGLSPP